MNIYTQTVPFRMKKLCLVLGATTSVALLGAGNSYAQATNAAPQQTQEIVVSASRIERAGFTAPTPTTSLGSADLEKRGTTNVADALNEIPAFRATSTPTGGSNGTFTGAAQQGQNFLDLRGLGATRTLVLVNGRRVVPSNVTGSVDLNMIPTILIDRTETVTGGASAAWGSDAVAGVVNLILKNNLNGLQADVSYGQSEHGDAKETRFAMAGGTDFAGGKGHVVLGGEYVDSGKVGDYLSRDWSRQSYGILSNPLNATNGQPRNIIGANMNFALQNSSGLIPTGPLAGTTFVYGPSGSTTRAFQPGQTFGNSANMFGGEGFGVTNNIFQYLKTPVKRYNLFGRASYELSDSINSWAELSTAGSENDNSNAPPRGNYTIKKDNAYLDAALTPAQFALVPAGGVTLGRFDKDFGPYAPVNKNTTNRLAFGLKGDLSETWSWDTYYQIGQTKLDAQQHNNMLTANFNASMDAINSGGTIVCRNPNLVTNTSTGVPITAAPGCVPVNLLGNGAPSQAALNYFMGTSWFVLKTQEQVAAVNVHGEPFSTWAGVVSLASGLEYRVENADQTVDALSQANAWNSGNSKALHGKYDVKEGYFETLVPLASQMAWAKSLDFNAAARRTLYSTSGGVTTWKAGLTYQPTNEWRLRATRSLDIRAPNLNELYAGSVFSQPLIIGKDGVSRFTPLFTTGSTSLRPEIAHTKTAGVVYEPSWAPGLKTSVDIYRIKMEGQITALGGPQILTRCLAGAADLCSLITWNTNPAVGPVGQAGGVPASIINPQINLLGFKTSGTDLEASYRFKLATLVNGLGGDLNIRVLGTYVDHFQIIDTIGTTDLAGQTGVGTNTANTGVAKWVWNTSFTYTQGPLSVTPQIRYVAKGIYDVTLVGPNSPNYSPTLANSINNNTVPSRTYVNLSAQYDTKISGQSVQFYGVVNNLFDRDPPLVPSANVITNAAYFDTIGRAFRLGARVKF